MTYKLPDQTTFLTLFQALLEWRAVEGERVDDIAQLTSAELRGIAEDYRTDIQQLREDVFNQYGSDVGHFIAEMINGHADTRQTQPSAAAPLAAEPRHELEPPS